MDIDLARTFLEVVGSGSFVAAAERLHLTQTAVSARIKTLEDQLGRRLFIRNKSGAHLTPAGQRFQHDALTLVQVWESAKQRIALLPNQETVFNLGAELSLWDPLVTNWLIWMRTRFPQVALRTEIAAPAPLLEGLRNGALHLAVLYNPPSQPDLVIELLTDEKLVMVATGDDDRIDPNEYVHVDWGPAFKINRDTAFPNLANPSLSVSLGPLALSYLLTVGGVGYFRLSAVRPYLAERRLRLVRNAPEFSYSVHVAYSRRSDTRLLDQARAALRSCVASPVP